MAKQDYIPAGIQPFMVRHDQHFCHRFPTSKSEPSPAATADSTRGKLMRRTKTDSTGANRGNGEGKENLCSLRLLLLNSGRDGDADFKFLARDTSPTCVD